MALNEYLIDKSEYLKKLRSNLEEMENQLRQDIVSAITKPEVERRRARQVSRNPARDRQEQ